MEFRVLGSIEVEEGGQRLAIASGRQLALLACLLVHANRVVSSDRILDELWGDEPPDSGAKTVAFHISRLRDSLEPGRARGQPNAILATEPAGYVLHVPPEAIDAFRFERLIADGRASLVDAPETARARLAEGLALWRGRPYAELADEPFLGPEIQRLEELRLVALEDRVEADLALGRHVGVIDELAGLVAENPLRERLRGQLMVALYRAGRQAEALRTYAAGRQLLAAELGIDPGPELQQLEGWILRQDPRLDPPTHRRPARNPYKGLRPFEERDGPDFFGREALVERLVEHLGHAARAGRFLVVVGPSGSGKSSAVRAGLVPALRSGALPGSERWRIAVMLPGARPLRELAAALRSVGPDVPPDLEEHLEQGGDLAAVIARLAPDDARILLVIDQLEELFSVVEDPVERARFVTALVGALAARDGRLLVVATLRADHFADPLLSPELGELVRTGTEVVTPLTRDGLERAVVRPAASVGVQLEPGLATEVITDVARQPGELPLLQYALTELFERSDGTRLAREGYAAIGGVFGALGRQADDVYAGLDAEGRETARQVFLRLVAPGPSGEPVARRVARPELDALSADHRRVDAVIAEFGRRGLLSFDRDAVGGNPTVQVAHEALLSRWPRLAGWIEEAREDIWTRRRLADAASEWIEAGRDPGFLLAGSRLDLFVTWAASTRVRLGVPEQELLDASRAQRHLVDEAAAASAAHERALERRATTRLRALVAVLIVAAIVASSLTVVVYGQGQAAREQSAIATARELAAASIGNLGTNPRLSLLLAVRGAEATADRGYVVEEAMDALHWALQASHVPYPAGDLAAAVQSAPGGTRGIFLVEPDALIPLATKAAGRDLTPQECRAYLHRPTCPASPGAPGVARRLLRVHTEAGVLDVGQLASSSLAGTRVDAFSAMPVDLASEAASTGELAGIDVAWGSGADADLLAHVAAGNPPDVAIVARPATVATLARAGGLVDMSTFVDTATLRAAAGDYVASLGLVGSDGSWPSTAGGLYGAPLAVEDKSLVWYPKGAFDRAGYVVPRMWGDLSRLASQMVRAGQSPWCLGLAGSVKNASAVDFVEEFVLRTAALDVYDKWATQPGLFDTDAVRAAFRRFDDLALSSGAVFGGLASAERTPQDLAAWPMFSDPPGCWLHLAGGTTRQAWPEDPPTPLAAFTVPDIDPAHPGTVRGRVFSVVVFHDRPEVRRLVTRLLSDSFAAEVTASLVGAGIWPVAPTDPAFAPNAAAVVEMEALRSALRGGTFRVAASDLMPAAVADAFAQGVGTYLKWGSGPGYTLPGIVSSIDRIWEDTP
jgi:DNA-binding SARP family transcriptional activator/ABC-type glycerol-3-phosphate transport system substrate-binding protein